MRIFLSFLHPSRARGIVVLFVCLLAQPLVAATTLAVMPFAPLQGESQAWLSKGIADLLIRGLSESSDFIVVDRERLQMFTQEAELGAAPLFTQDRAVQLGRIAKVQQVLYGNYTVSGDSIQLSVFLIDLKDQRPLQKEAASGSLADLRKLTRQLALDILAHRGVHLTADQEKNIGFDPTDSTAATEHFYRGIDDVDHGRSADAFGEFYAAAKQDPHYAEAWLWMARMSEALGSWDQAVAGYMRVAREHAKEVEALDASLFAASLLTRKLQKPEEAAAAYESIIAIAPVSAEGLEAAYQLGLLREEQDKRMAAYRAYQLVSDAHDRLEKKEIEPDRKVRYSPFFSWTHAAQLYQNAVVRMIGIYPDLVARAGRNPWPPKPPGLIVVDEKNPVYKEAHWGDTPALFHQEGATERWDEKIYVLMAPPGTEMTGVDLAIRGILKQVTPHNDYTMQVLPFPLPRDEGRRWLGSIFGQTPQLSTLHKTVWFHGTRYRLLTLRVLENGSEIDSWELRLRLQTAAPAGLPSAENAPLKPEKKFYEGQPLGTIPLPAQTAWGNARPLAQGFYRPQREVAIASGGEQELEVAAVLGELDGEQTDLYLSRSVDGGRHWTPLDRLPTNSLSEDYGPRFVRAEDGSLHLFWLSNRRGAGWELWTSHAKPSNELNWSEAERIPLEKYSPDRTGRNETLTPLLEYDVIQDRRGRWVVAYDAPGSQTIVVLRSRDLGALGIAARITSSDVSGISLFADRAETYRLAATDGAGHIHVWSSNDGTQWRDRMLSNYVNPTPGVHALKFVPAPAGATLLASDNIHGLQYFAGSLDGDTPGLVSRAELEAFSAAPVGNRTLVALKDGEKITVRAYDRFNTTGVEPTDHSRDWGIYQETERDDAGRLWNRFTAQERFRVPDVTSLGVEPAGRIWWGIETGIMFKDGDRFFATDVSQGFFNNDVSEMALCDAGSPVFASRNLDGAVIGYAAGTPAQPSFRTWTVPGVHGSITALACATHAGRIYVGSSDGDIVGPLEISAAGDLPSSLRQHLNSRVNAIVAEPHHDAAWVGTETGLFRCSQTCDAQTIPGLSKAAITSIVFDAHGSLWVAVRGHGIAVRRGSLWQTVNRAASIPRSVGTLAADPVKGVWLVADAETPSPGLVYFDGEKASVYNPPHDRLDAPSALAVDKAGNVWVGTWFKGLYEWVRKQ